MEKERRMRDDEREKGGRVLSNGAQGLKGHPAN